MTVSDIRSQVKTLLDERRSGAATGNSPAIKPQFLLVGLGAGLIGWLLLRPTPSQTAPAADTGNAQIDQAMQMLQQQQDINRELLKGQQELNAQMIEAQSKAKTVQPSINCFFAVCPGTGKQEATPDQQYAIVGEGIRTARVNPSQVLPQIMQAPTVPPVPQPTPQPYNAIQVSASTVAEQEYQRLSRALIENPELFYNTAWEWKADINSSESTAQALRRIFQEIPQSRPY